MEGQSYSGILIYDDYHGRIRRGGIIGTIAPQAGNPAPRHNYKLISIVIQDNMKNFRIRRLTERECFRLMGVTESDIDKIQAAGISRTQQYKMAGNSIVVDVMATMFRNLFCHTEEGLEEQLSLF